jgi:hypothetical protein
MREALSLLGYSASIEETKAVVYASNGQTTLRAAVANAKPRELTISSVKIEQPGSDRYHVLELKPDGSASIRVRCRDELRDRDGRLHVPTPVLTPAIALPKSPGARVLLGAALANGKAVELVVRTRTGKLVTERWDVSGKKPVRVDIRKARAAEYQSPDDRQRAIWDSQVRAEVMTERVRVIREFDLIDPSIPNAIRVAAWRVKTGQARSTIYRYQGEYFDVHSLAAAPGFEVKRVPKSQAGDDFVPWTSPPP